MTKITQKPGRLDIVAAQTDAFSLTLDFDIDLTGYNFTAQVDESTGGTKSFTVTPSTDLGTDGIVVISMVSTDTADLALADHNWQLNRTDASNERRYIAGKFTVIKYFE